VDYTATFGNLSFGPGVMKQSFKVPVINNTLDEPNKTVNLTLSDPTGGAILGTPSTAVLTITDNDKGGMLRFSAATYSVNEARGVATIRVVRSGGSASGVTVDYATSDGTATAGVDYTATSGTLSFGAGVRSQSFTIPITNDTLDEPNETVNITLSDPTGGAILGTPSTAVLTITDNDKGGTLGFSAAKYSVSEAGGSATITVMRTGGSASGVTVDYATSDGTAIAGVDYTATFGTLSFDAGELSKSFTIPIVDDGLAEGNKTVNLTLSNPTGGAILGTRSTAVLTIVDDEVGLQFSSATYSVGEGGAATVTVVRTDPTTATVGVNYAMSDGTATAGVDYTATSGTLTFGAGVRSRTFKIPITRDSLLEADETVNLTLSNPTGGAILGTPSTAVLTVVNK